MKIQFQTKEESNEQQQKNFLQLSKAERLYAFFRLMERVNKFPVKKKHDKNIDNFIIQIPAK
jgi:hypothetical protein